MAALTVVFRNREEDLKMLGRCGVFCWAIILTVCADYHSQATGQDTLADQFWHKIRSVEADDPRLLKTNPYEYWCDVAYKCRQEFYGELRAMGAKERSEVVKHYVQQFGEDGAISDFHWLCCDMSLTLPGVRPTGHLLPPTDREWMVPIRKLLCQEIVQRCLRERSFLKRYYHAVMWSGAFLGTPKTDQGIRALALLHKTRQGIKTEDENEYWWWARNAVVLLYAFGHEMLLENAIADKLGAPTVRVAEWVYRNSHPFIADEKEFRWRVSKGTRLPVFSLPKAPFPDWDSRIRMPERKVVLVHNYPADEPDEPVKRSRGVRP